VSAAPAPSFKGLRPASEAASRAKQRNRKTDTQHEVALRRALWSLGVRFRKHMSSLPGNPDLAFMGARVVVFCDGDFWHGRHWESLREKLSGGTNASYWVLKIAANRERDERNTRLLEEAGWKVLRLWETDIRRDPTEAALAIKEEVERRRTARRAR
jgi:DNA mismatch endonuclease, patch repair protein